MVYVIENQCFITQFSAYIHAYIQILKCVLLYDTLFISILPVLCLDVYCMHDNVLCISCISNML